ncbi:hypothetical protein GQ43DRAFT_440828 [Delitschia confertaspora ATCC 74209]|uniref:Uncharacterized protein n=1 Tax=Delitschia confertaspora ATCC 74209 TaxID=1513339 RepID=A0A9P4MSN3_9PLEO|nr:hypothetical protein GQ43DRAFT_440828 [Delitschia confertaspora ATCC 74209]
MVVLVDLEDDDIHSLHTNQHQHAGNGFITLKQLHHSWPARNELNNESVEHDDRPNPNINGFSACLSCYPVVSEVARQIDLNTLHNLSRTCRQFRANLLEYRDQLVKNTLHCGNENVVPGAMPPKMTSGKIGKCARDMVGECQRCGTVVCRNCTIKPPPIPALKGRHRRLCRTCTKAPLHLLTVPSRHSIATSPSSTPKPDPPVEEPKSDAFTAPAFQRTPCSCSDKVWLCQPCGHQLRTADTIYQRGWTWRTRYSHYLGGVGTGAGEGNEGVKCGRGPFCLAAQTVEYELDGDSEIYADSMEEANKADAEGMGRGWKGTSYMVQEIEGVGGVVRRKIKQHVRVGAVVKIWEDEKGNTMACLEREARGELRSWCSWCERVVLGKRDLEGAGGESADGNEERRASRSSTSSQSSHSTGKGEGCFGCD